MDLARTFGIREGTRLAVVDAPVRFRDDLGPLINVEHVELDGSPVDCIAVFVKSRDELAARLGDAGRALVADGSLWVAWPKQMSGYATDLSADVVQAAGRRLGLLDVRRLSVNEGWTAMRFIVRMEDRSAWTKRSFDE
ncbi:MAG: DUF3052 family protein [Acidimicrobiia bacterium]|nr:DUF3052 family protein [Acidimicrobiia bacterium]NNF10680.1 DUF3052 family protein [Acidimicrobiia bacterium]NNL71666.1 DUF3052 family protein [Acidimicrobiia bacterium]